MVLPTFSVIFHISDLLTAVSITVNSNFLGGNWSRSSNNTGNQGKLQTQASNETFGIEQLRNKELVDGLKSKGVSNKIGSIGSKTLSNLKASALVMLPLNTVHAQCRRTPN